MKQPALLLWVMLLAGIATGQESPLPPVTNTYVLHNVNIVTRPGEMIEMGSVLVKDGLIQAVGQEVDVPYDAQILDADSMYVYAGFIDGLSHAGIEKKQEGEGENGRRPDVEDRGNPPNELAGIQPQRQAGNMLNPKDRAVGELRQLGFTAAHVVPEEGMLPGYGALILLAGEEAPDMVLRDKAAFFSQLEGARGVYPATVIAVMSKWRELYKQAEQGMTHEERYAENPKGMTRPAYDPALQAFYPVLKGDVPVFFRAEDVKSAYRVYAMQDELDFPLVLAGLKEGWHLIDKIKSEQTPVFLALELPDAPKKKDKKGDDQEKEMSEEMKKLEARRAEAMKQLESQAAVLAENGVDFGFSSLDAKGKDIRANLRRMIDAGLSEDAALAALTTTPAKILGLEETMGTVETGKMANLVVSDKPYFEEESKVRFVLVDGQLFEYEEGGPTKASDPAAVAQVAGTWNYKIDVPGQSMGGTISLTDNNGVLEGTVSNPQTQESTNIQEPVVEGNSLRFVTRFEGGGMVITAEWVLELDGETFEGSVSTGQMGTFDVEGERVPQEER